jgi:hypothetical protein
MRPLYPNQNIPIRNGRFYLRRLLFFASSMSFFASNRFLVFFELDRCPVIQLPLFAI